MTEQETPVEKKGIYGWAGRHPKATFFFVILIIVVVFVFLFDRSAKNQLNRQIAEARARGEPMSVDDLNASRSAPPATHNPAIILLGEAASLEKTINVKLPADKQRVLPIIGDPNPPPTGVPLPQEELEALRWYFDSMESELYPSSGQTDLATSAPDSGEHDARDRTLQGLRDDILRILTMPGGRLEFQAVTPLVNTSTPELAQYRAISKFLSASSVRYMELADGEECRKDLQAQLALTRQLKAVYPSLIQALVTIANEARAVDMIERAVNRAALDEETIALLKFELEEIETSPDLHRALMWERVMFLDSYEWIRSGGGGGLGVTAPGAWSSLRLFPVLPSLDVSPGLKVYGRLIEATADPLPETLKSVDEVKNAVDNLPAYHLFTRLMLPSLSRSVELWLRNIGSKRALIAGLACERYRLANREWPESLTDLVPEYLKAVPVDPFDGAPIRYAITSQGIELWCIGEDLKDDGGDIKRRDKKGPNDRPTDWGWLILNPDLRGKPLPEPVSATTTSTPATQNAGN